MSAIFNKESLDVNEQLDLLIKRGLIVNDYNSAVGRICPNIKITS